MKKEIFHTHDLASPIYRDALQLRKTIFVGEQGVPLAEEVDQNEAACEHFVLYTENKPVATCRLLPMPENVGKLQRMAVAKEARKHGYGRELIKACESWAAANRFQMIRLGAQLSALPFYVQLGYRAYGAEFLDAGIRHRMMEKRL